MRASGVTWSRWGRAVVAWGVSAAACAWGAGPETLPSHERMRHQFERDFIRVAVEIPSRARGLVEGSVDSPETLGGFAPRALQEAAEVVGLRVRLVPVESLDMERALLADEVDVVAPMSVTSDRVERVAFTMPIMVARGAVYARPGTERADSAELLRGTRVTTARNGVGQLWCVERQVPSESAPTLREAFTRVLRGEADYLVTTMPAGRSSMEESGVTGLLEWTLEDERLWRAFAYAVRPGDLGLLADLNNGLAVLRDSGRFERLYDQTAGRYQPRLEAPEVPRRWLWWTALAGAAAVSTAMLAAAVTQRRLRRKTEDLLTAQRERKLLFDEVPALVYTYFVGTDGSRRLLSVGEGLERWQASFPGFLPAEKWESTLGPRMHPADVEAYRATTARSRTSQGVFAAEYRLMDKDGKYRWLHSRASPTPAPDGTVWSAMLMDVTDVREMRAQLERTETLYRELFDNCPEAILLVRVEDGTVAEANLAALDLYGYRREDLVGGSYGKVRGGGPEPWGAQAQEVLRAGYAQFEGTHVRSDGAFLDVEVVGSLVEIGGDRQVLAIVRDVSERKRMERQRAALESELQSARQMEALGVMAGGIAHDFNNVLVGILGNASLARRQVGSPAALESSLTRIEDAGQFAADLVRQLMEYAGRRPLKCEDVELSTLTREAVQTLGSRVRAAVRLHGPECWVRGDVVSIKQAVMNLLTNASDAVGEGGGEIRVRCGLRRFDPANEPACAAGRDLPAGEYGFVCVENPGPGLDEGIRRRMFEPFVTTKGHGRGLGLAMVLTAMQRNGGAVSVRTQAGVGTWFELLLPPAVRKAPEASPRAWDVLVVDDDPSVRATLRELMRLEGHACREAASGEEGLSMAAASPPDVMILDVKMPGMSGWEVLRELRRREIGTAVVVSSGHTTRSSDGEVRADAVLPKPYTLEQLRASMQEAAASRRAATAAASAPA